MKKTLKTNPDNARVHYNLGTAYAQDKENDLAKIHFEKAIKLNNQYAAAYGNLGQIIYLEGDIDGSIGYFEKSHFIGKSFS